MAPEGDGGLESRAEACLADPSCPAAEVARLFVMADDAHDPAVDCLQFIDGVTAKRDLPRARACLERQLAGSDCGGSSLDLDGAALALMRVDGVGGKQDIFGARALLATCFDDVTRSAVLEHADAKERDPKAPPMDFCKDIGGTTLTMNSCAARARANEEARGQLRAKAVAAGLDDAQKGLFAAATKAYAAYVEAMIRYAYQVYVEGTIRNAVALERGRELYARRTTALAAFESYTAPETSAAQAALATKASAAALARVTAANEDEKKDLADTQRAWTVYRDAEVAFYVSVFGPTQGTDRVKSAMIVRLEKELAKECAAPALGN
jgi:hypothetical protein